MKLISHYYLPDTGETKVVLANRYGQYEGTSRAHPDDLSTASEFAGARLAERRAWIKALKSDVRRYKQQRNALISFGKDLYNTLGTVPKEVTQRFYIYLDKYEQDIKYTEEAIDILQRQEKLDIEIRDKILQRANKNK